MACERTTRVSPHKRRGQVDIPVVMIFAVVTGVFLLLGVGYAVIRTQSDATQAQRLENLADMRTTIASFEGSPGITQNITLLADAGGLRAQCESGTDWVIGYGTDDLVTLSGQLVAIPPRIDSERATVRTAMVGTAYRIGTIVYLQPTGMTIEVGDTLPALPIPATVGSGDQITVRSTPDADPISYPVERSRLIPGAGLITLPTVAGDTIALPYFEPGLLAAAATSGTAEGYSCVLNRYVQQLAFATEVQHRRMLTLRTAYFDAENRCSDYYDEAPFKAIEQVLYTTAPLPPAQPNQIRTVDNPLDNTLRDMANIEKLAGALRSVNELNDRLLRGDRCATVS